jgi:hypothetical protein
MTYHNTLIKQWCSIGIKLLSHPMVQCVRQTQWHKGSPYLTPAFCLHLSKVTSKKLIDTACNSRSKNWPHYSTNAVTAVWIPVWYCSDNSWHSVCFNLQEFIFHTKDNMQTLQWPEKYRVLMTELANIHITVVNSWEWLSIWQRFSVGFSQTNAFDLQPLYPRPQKQLQTVLGN